MLNSLLPWQLGIGGGLLQASRRISIQRLKSGPLPDPESDGAERRRGPEPVFSGVLLWVKHAASLLFLACVSGARMQEEPSWLPCPPPSPQPHQETRCLALIIFDSIGQLGRWQGGKPLRSMSQGTCPAQVLPPNHCCSEHPAPEPPQSMCCLRTGGRSQAGMACSREGLVKERPESELQHSWLQPLGFCVPAGSSPTCISEMTKMQGTLIPRFK